MRFESVSLRYTRRGPYVLDGIGLDLAPGTITAVVGGNGCGKSSLLKVAAGLVRPTAGSVRHRPPRIGYVPERLPSTMRLSARAYLLHMGRVQGLGTRAADRRGGELLDRLRVEGDIDAPISTLSKGNAQKVALAQAMLADPRLLVLDEPWSGLDTPTHRILMECLSEQRAAGVTVLLTEHRPGTVAASADAVHRLHRGRLIEQRPVPADPDGFDLTLGTPPTAEDSRATEDALGRLPGVSRVHADRGRVRLRTTETHRDAVLLTVLRQGYTVLTVHAAPPGEAQAGDADAVADPPGESR
ncbi:ABC transporter ATP-binding protein [Streptomyces sp. AM 4-1-1]|uniref:ATP-binding cassette domain-containing protein n=1 Tax=Streptomyces sp. AM 4-1-1 TaxID=3028710 RepID=UPI0023B99315|nr:ABC transporter ATP-binding protein [Streptomyces sp. AM 4-1-1]WEH35558.1 ABC transporter ATP-binding protein [Streptomyces sp. AM 4-1-1]